MFGGRKGKGNKGKADKGKRPREKKDSGNELAGMFGLDMPMPDEKALEAELLAMTGGASVNIDKMMGDIDNDDVSDASDMDDDALLGELQALEDQEDEPTPPPVELPPSRPPPQQPSPRGMVTRPSGGSVDVVSARLELYKRAMSTAEGAGESSKAKRYKRGVTTLEQMLKSAKAGKIINEDDLPPEIAPPKAPPANSSQDPPPAKKAAPQPKNVPPPVKADGKIDLDDPQFDEFNLSEEDLAAMAAMMDKEQGPPSVKKAPPPPKPAQRPPKKAPAPVKADGKIDLDDPQFDEFNISEEDMAAMAAMMVDDRQKQEPAKPSPQPTARPRPQPPQPQPQAVKPSSSLPAKMAPAKTTPSSSEGESVKGLLHERREQYLAASKNNPSKSKEYRIMAAQFNRVIKALDEGQEVDLSQMPGPPPGYKSIYNIDTSKLTPPKPQPQAASPTPSPNSSLVSEPEDVDPEIPVPKTTMEALQQRIAKYQETVKTAEEKGESSRVRRLGRIVKSYDAAIKATKAGKPFDYEELPAPPGYPPIPAPRMGVASKPVVPPTQSLPVSKPVPVAKPKASLNSEQLRLVEVRRAELQKAARTEQAAGNKEKALEYLRLRKGIDTMLEAARGGIRVNLEELPPSPFADLATTQPSQAVLGHLKPASENDNKTFDLIEEQLQKQIAICNTNSETYSKMGSTPTAIQYKNMAQNCQKELLAIKAIRSQNLAPPKFTTETRKLTIVTSNAELSSSVCEVLVMRGHNLPKPGGYEEKDMAVYVEVEFPWPADQPAKESTTVVKDTVNPEFEDQRLQFDIDRKKIKTMTRTFKRTPVKCGVWQKRTLRKDLFIGQAQLNIEGLETRSQVKNTVDLMDERGRKQVGGKLELVARLREPLAGPDKEEREEQWLVFQESIAAKSAVVMPKPGAGGGKTTPNIALMSPVRVEDMVSLEALKLEMGLIQAAVKAGHRDKPTATRGKLIKDRMEAVKSRLSADPGFRSSYSKVVSKEMAEEQTLEARLTKQGKRGEVTILQKRRAAMEKELKALSSR